MVDLSHCWCEVKADGTLRAFKTLLDPPILLLMGCQKPVTVATLDSTDFMMGWRAPSAQQD